ncbi:Uncharacterised protein [Pantoea agglomerans]|uniref:Uncharacterized protein n=1 Tax=Enterobacter agglomerans TaxID=549 RepID=A0A379LS07_ENTAG|nr:Uncharacterised protein [Pantoea agglomerans]
MTVEEIKAGLPFRTVLFGRVYFLIIFNRFDSCLPQYPAQKTTETDTVTDG